MPASSMSYGSGLAKYSKLMNETDSPNRRAICNQNLRLTNDKVHATEDNKPMNFEFDER